MLVLGVCGMHTLGHVSSAHSAAAAMHERPSNAALVPAQQPRAEAHVVNPWQPAAVGASVIAQAFNDEMPGFDPTSVCLAVLVPLLILALIASAALVRRAPAGVSAAIAGLARVARPPPTSVRLARLSLLRI
ncbi:hypothetical protein ABZ297_04235 [Nonomuraea sp. NPDC005983]|uniref:hypothetical protein n=1 Tax=Nonomuraea sp. NPDC005983 TaxID=3155595 RepID=UPI0033A8F647